MKTVGEVAKLTGVSPRTLQYYDEIGLLKPSALTQSNYRLYDDDALERLQQILFYKELGFKLNEIKEIFQKSGHDKVEVFKKQRELLLLKRNRTNRLIQLLSRLEKGEQCMSFKEFDLSEYIEALEKFKNHRKEEVIEHWGSVEVYERFIQRIKDHEAEVAKVAIKEFGSVEEFTETIKNNLEHISELIPKKEKELGKKADILYSKLTADLSESPASSRVQKIVRELLQNVQKNDASVGIDPLIDIYSRDYIREITDRKYGRGAADYIVKAFQYYSENN